MTRRGLILGDGDSMVANPPANPGTDLLTLVAARVYGQPQTRNIAVSGSSGYNSGYDTLPIPDYGYLHTGHNSYNTGVTGVAVHASITAAVSAWRAAGIRTIVVGTTFPGVDITGGEDTERLAGNALIVADKCGADDVVDWTTIPYFTDTTNFQDDGIHPPEVGRLLMAQTIAARINSLAFSA